MALELVNRPPVLPIPSSFTRFFVRFRPPIHHSSFTLHHCLSGCWSTPRPFLRFPRRLVPLSSLVSPLSRTLTIADWLARFQARFLGHLREKRNRERRRIWPASRRRVRATHHDCGWCVSRTLRLGNPHRALALLSDPGRTDASGHYDASAWPPLCPRRRLPQRSFRGSITRLRHWLSTLRRPGYPTPRKTRFRLLARLSRTGLTTRRVPTKGFTMYPTFDPPFPSST